MSRGGRDGVSYKIAFDTTKYGKGEKRMTNTRNPVGWFEVYVNDMDRAKGFYEKTLGVSLTLLKQSGGSLDNMWAFPMHRDGGGATGALAKMDGAPVGAGGTIIYFVCDDCAEAAKRAKQAGGHIVKDKFSIGDYGNIALVSDLDGNVIGFHSMN